MSSTDVFARPKYDVITQTKTLTSRAKSATMIVLMGTSAFATPTDVKATPRPDIITQTRTVSSWKGNPLITILSVYPNDIVTGFDNFEGFGTPTPDFIQAQKVPLVTSLTSYASYAPGPDIIYPQFRRKPDFQIAPDFIKQQGQYPNNLIVQVAPVGDLTTLQRKPQSFWPASYNDQKNNGAWHIVLFPLGPLPPPPPPPPPPVWPPPSTITNLPVRGAWELPGGKQAIWVVGNGAYLMTVATPATGSAQTTFALKLIGTLNTSAGYVCIRDNGAGGAVALVDGAYGYYYIFAAAGATAQWPIGSFYQITDPNFSPASRVCFIDGWWVFNIVGTQEFFTPTSTYNLTFNGTNFALKDGATDNLVTMYENKEELWLIGEKTTEIWYDAGGTYFAFARLVSTMLQIGCSAPASIARFESQGSDGLVWFGKTERGQNVVVRTEGFSTVVISTPAINHEFAKLTFVSDAIGYTYQEDGHEFYVLTFPTAVTALGTGTTWCYDNTTDMWHQRLSYEPYSQSWNRHRSNCFLSFQNQRLVGDYQNGAIYQMTRFAYTDSGWPLVAWRRTPHIWDGAARERVFMAYLQIDFRPGVGNQGAVMGTNPQAFLQISRDGGTTWGQILTRYLGKAGQFLNRVIWRRLSFSRDAVIDVKVYDPVNRDVVGATLKKGEQ
jgi:hypothetical protein